MEIALKYVPTPMEATSAHVNLVMHLVLITDHAMTSMNVQQTMEIALKYVPTPMKAIYVHVKLVIF